MSRRVVIAVAVLGVLACSGVLIAVGLEGSGPSPRSPGTVTTTSTAKRTKAIPATFVGTFGVEARWVLAENKRAGTTSWQIQNTPKDNAIDGFANLTSAAKGQIVTLYVSTDARRFHVDAYRMGYYGGSGARLIWASHELPGKVQAPCQVTAGINMVSCDHWTPTLKVTITAAFVQGDYLFKLVGSGNQQSYVPLTVWDPTSHSAYLIKNDVYTWQAWNPYGGDDFYQGTATCSPTYPPCSRARVVSFDRPYAYGEGAADFLSEEYPLIRFAEQHGLDVSYATDVTIEQHPKILSDHRVLLSLGHDECWSLDEREAAQHAQQKGLNIVFFGASAVLRHVRLQASPLGPDREVVDYRESAEDPLDGEANPLLVTGNTWSSPPTDWPETAFVGESYAGYLAPSAPHVAFVVADASAWVFRGTHLHNGSSVPGVIASDFDTFETAMPHPQDVEILGHSFIPLAQAQTNAAGLNGTVYSDMTYYTDPVSHAGVFDSGTNNWIPALSACAPGTRCPARIVARITGNLLRVFGQGPAGDIEPSAANWSRFAP